MTKREKNYRGFKIESSSIDIIPDTSRKSPIPKSRKEIEIKNYNQRTSTPVKMVTVSSSLNIPVIESQKKKSINNENPEGINNKKENPSQLECNSEQNQYNHSPVIQQNAWNPNYNQQYMPYPYPVYQYPIYSYNSYSYPYHDHQYSYPLSTTPPPLPQASFSLPYQNIKYNEGIHKTNLRGNNLYEEKKSSHKKTRKSLDSNLTKSQGDKNNESRVEEDRFKNDESEIIVVDEYDWQRKSNGFQVKEIKENESRVENLRKKYQNKGKIIDDEEIENERESKRRRERERENLKENKRENEIGKEIEINNEKIINKEKELSKEKDINIEIDICKEIKDDFEIEFKREIDINKDLNISEEIIIDKIRPFYLENEEKHQELNFENKKIEEKKGVRLEIGMTQTKTLSDIFKEKKRRIAERITPKDHQQKQDHKEKTKEELIEIRKNLLKVPKHDNAKSDVIEIRVNERKNSKEPCSHLMERLATGQKVKVTKEEMLKLNKKNYQLLPEVKKRQEQEKKLIEKQIRLQKAREYERVRYNQNRMEKQKFKYVPDDD